MSDGHAAQASDPIVVHISEDILSWHQLPFPDHGSMSSTGHGLLGSSSMQSPVRVQLGRSQQSQDRLTRVGRPLMLYLSIRCQPKPWVLF